MQPITWTKEEFTASVNKKLAKLRAMGPGDGRTLDQRLALAKDRIAFDEARHLSDLRHVAKYGTPWSVSGSPVMARVTDDGLDEPSDSGQLIRSSGFTAADDSYGVSFALSASSGKATPAVPPSIDPEQPAPLGEIASDAPSHVSTELPSQLPSVSVKTTVRYDPNDLTVAQRESERGRLFEESARLSSKDWVVLDRASVLQCLAAHAEGLTLVQLAALMLGAFASPRDTRRLSAMMKREEDRRTVNRAGRGQPIVLTELGKAQLDEMDVKALSQRMAQIRAKRVDSQRLRLQGLRPATPTSKKALLPKRCARRKSSPDGNASPQSNLQ